VPELLCCWQINAIFCGAAFEPQVAAQPYTAVTAGAALRLASGSCAGDAAENKDCSYVDVLVWHNSFV
jgi:hypothetical protein